MFHVLYCISRRGRTDSLQHAWKDSIVEGGVAAIFEENALNLCTYMYNYDQELLVI